ncbi:hypothetical protein ACQVWE_13215 [Bacillus cereus]|uniref:hypothetical protein n=1 Tax=Bacillus cereus TaxID=1396 RepID=UPI003D66021F
MARARSHKDLVEFKIREINKYLSGSGQSLVLNEGLENDEPYWALKWERDLDADHVMEEHVYSGEIFDIFVCLSGIENGIRMQRYKEESHNGIRTNTGS